MPPLLPIDDPLRATLHNEVHARPPAHVLLPALLVYVVVLNDGISREQEWAHVCRLPGLERDTHAPPMGPFLQLQLPGLSLKWERHTEFTRYTLTTTLPSVTQDPDDEWLLSTLPLPADWLAGIPGTLICAIQMLMLQGDHHDPEARHRLQQDWFAHTDVVASYMGSQEHSLTMSDFRLRDSGFERIVVLTDEQTSTTRAGRVSQRLLDLETYRMMALRGLPVAKTLAPELSQTEKELANISAAMHQKQGSDQEMLDRLVQLAARVERALAEHSYRFSATRAYHALVKERIGELRERPIAGTQTLGEFMQRRLEPAMATVASGAQRLSSLSERVARTSALLRTRVDIATETQNQELLAQLTRGQSLQLRLQSTVEGLSIAAISYYVISLLLYAAKALKSAGLPIHPELTAGAAMPFILWGVWKTIRHIHHTLHAEH